MNLSKRLIIQFILQHIFVLFTLLIAVVIAFGYFAILINSSLSETNVSEFDNSTISSYVSFENSHITLNAKVKETIQKKRIGFKLWMKTERYYITIIHLKRFLIPTQKHH